MHLYPSFLRLIAAVVLPFFAGIGCAAETSTIKSELHEFRVVTLVEGLQHPWSIAWLPDGRMLVAERPGRLRMVSPEFKLDPQPIEGLPKIEATGQGGLFDVVLHPRYAENGWIYISYNASGAGGHGTELMRARLDGHRLVEQQVLFQLQPKSRAGQHFGGRIVFDGKGHVYLTLGDRGERNRAQQLNDHAGSVIRLNEDGSVPADNPFVKRSEVRPEIYAAGIRNIQSAALHPQTAELWVADHGPQGGDEVNIIRAGRNYGWPLVTRGREYGTGRPIGVAQREGFEPALHYWVPTSIAPSGFAFYEGERFPKWRGNALIGALRGEMLVRLEVDRDKVLREEQMMSGAIGRIRDVRVGPDGYVYLLTDERRGVLARLEPVN
jgi:aldose sugar dehydrogenase